MIRSTSPCQKSLSGLGAPSGQKVLSHDRMQSLDDGTLFYVLAAEQAAAN